MHYTTLGGIISYYCGPALSAVSANQLSSAAGPILGCRVSTKMPIHDGLE